MKEWQWGGLYFRDFTPVRVSSAFDFGNTPSELEQPYHSSHHSYLTPQTAPKPGSFWPEPWLR
jgi:hypothetical protein